MYAIFGLGNPGRKYQNTRHNIGYRIIDEIAAKNEVPFKPGKGDYYFSETKWVENRIILIKPTTYMNQSGNAVRQVLNYFPVQQDHMLIIYDDFNLPFGTLRYRSNGSDGGHKGIKSIIYQLKSDWFDRLRFGIGNEFDDSVSYVLSAFTAKEKQSIREILPLIIDSVSCWITEGIESTMNRYNRTWIL